LVHYAKYPRGGTRGFSMTRAVSYGFGEIARNSIYYFWHFNRETLIIPQCETRACLDNIEKIVAVPGVDSIFIELYYFSTVLGRPTYFENPDFNSAVEKVFVTCRSKGKHSLMLSFSMEQTKTLFDQGFSDVVFSLDIYILINGYKSVVSVFLNDLVSIPTSSTTSDGHPFVEYIARLGLK